MFERFTDRARRALVLGQEQARSLNHSSVGTEHVLLGLLAEGEGVAARALRELSVEADAVRNRVIEQVPSGRSAPEEQIPFTGHAKKAMEWSVEEALTLGHNYIGTEHVLLGLLNETDGMASQVLTAMGVDLSAARLKVVELLSEMGLAANDEPERGRPDEPPRPE